MRKLLMLSVTVAALVVLALPAGAAPPVIEIVTGPEPLESDNPCTPENDPIVFEAISTAKFITLPNGSQITKVSYQINGPDPWLGKGTDSSAELTDLGFTVSHRWTVTNSDTGQKFKFTIRGHFNEITGEWNPGAFAGATCVRP